MDVDLQADSDFGDDLLQAVVQEPVPSRAPVRGERLGGRDQRRFTILQELGGGSMGRVYRAWDEELGRVVALKFLIPWASGASEQQPAELLRQEARAIAQLDHENIVRLFDVDEWPSEPWAPPLPFLIMECLQGESLAALMRRKGRLGLREALEHLCGIAAGLAHAHEHRVIHRDLKPSNVFLTSKGKAKLLDFGLAWLLAGTGATVAQLPQAGTPAYMAPEQWRGEAQDERTDIWAAGILLYEMLTGTLPYASDRLEELRAQVLDAAPVPSVREHHPELPWEVEHLLATALAKDPARRFRGAQELAEELRELVERFGLRAEAPPPLALERRQVTLVSCRLVGLTGEARALDAEDLGELEAAFHQHCAEVVRKRGGTVALAMSHEVLACFGYPVAGEDDSECAVHAGLVLARDAHDFLQRLPHLPPDALAVRVGIHTDQVMVGEQHGAPLSQALTFQGEAPQVAGWLSGLAEPGTVLASEATWARVRGGFEAEPLGPRSYPGLTGPLRLKVYRVLRERPATVRFERVLAAGDLTPLVGREQALHRLEALWAEARQGRGGFVLISGEAGIGKSRLIRELRERRAGEDYVDLQCQCWPESRTSAFHPIIELLQRLLQTREAVREGRSPEALRRLAGMSPELNSLLAQLLSLPLPEGQPRPQLSPERLKARTFEAVTALLLRVTRERPVLCVVEDLHWADPSTLELLGYLLERARAPLLFVLSTRPDFQPAWPDRSWLHRLEQERLTAAHTATLVRAMARGRELPQETVDRLVERADGVPLFAEEMTRMVLERGGASAIPITLNELLLARVDRLPRRQKGLAQLCAVVGRSSSPPLLSKLTRLGPAALRRDLEALVAAGLLQPAEEATGPAYRFRHALLQEATYESLARRPRRQLHLRIAQALEAHFPQEVAPRPELLAHHYTEAGEYAAAVHHWMRAGQHASLRSANVEAVSHFQRALSLLPRLPATPEREQLELRLLIGLGTPLAQVEGFHSPEVEQTYARARELFRQVGEALPQLELSYWGPFSYYFSRGQYALAHELAEQLVTPGRHGSRELLTLGHRMLAAGFFIRGHMLQAHEHIEKSLACSLDFTLEEHRAQAERQGVSPRATALAFGALVSSAMGEDRLARRYGHDARALASHLGHAHTSASVLTYVAVACQLRHEAHGALHWAEQALVLAREHGFRAWRVWATLIHLWALGARGQAHEALESLHKAMEGWERAGIRASQHHDLGLRAELHLMLGQPGEALADTTEALKRVGITGERFYEAELHRLQGEALRALGREREARESFLLAFQVAREQGAHAFELRALRGLLAAEELHPV